jgi:hypothetical protein
MATSAYASNRPRSGGGSAAAAPAAPAAAPPAAPAAARRASRASVARAVATGPSQVHLALPELRAPLDPMRRGIAAASQHLAAQPGGAASYVEGVLSSAQAGCGQSGQALPLQPVGARDARIGSLLAPSDAPLRMARLGVLASTALLDSGLLTPAARAQQAGATYQNRAVDEMVAQLQLRLRPPPKEGVLAAAKEALLSRGSASRAGTSSAGERQPLPTGVPAPLMAPTAAFML